MLLDTNQSSEQGYIINNEDNVSNQEYQINEFLTFLSAYAKRQLKKNDRIIAPISLIISLLPIPISFILTNSYVDTFWKGKIYLKILFQFNVYSYFARNLLFSYVFFDKILSIFIDDRPKQEQLATGHKGTLFLTIKSYIPKTKNKRYKMLFNIIAYVGLGGVIGIILPEISLYTFSNTFISENPKKFFQSTFSNITYFPEIFGEGIFSIDLLISGIRYLYQKIHIKHLTGFGNQNQLTRARKLMVHSVRNEIIKNMERLLMIYRIMPTEIRKNHYHKEISEIYDGIEKNNLTITSVIRILNLINQTENSTQYNKRHFNKKMIFMTTLLSLAATYAMLGVYELDSGYHLLDPLSFFNLLSIPTFLVFLLVNLLINTKFSIDFVTYLFNLPQRVLYFIRYKSGDFPVIFQKNWKIVTLLALFTATCSLASFARYHAFLTWYPVVEGGHYSLLSALPVIPIFFSIGWIVISNVFKYTLNFIPTSTEDKQEIMADKVIESILHYLKICKNTKLLQFISSLNESQLQAFLPLENPETDIIQKAYNQHGLDCHNDSLYTNSRFTLFGTQNQLNCQQTIQVVKKMHEQYKTEKSENYDEERIPLKI